MLNLLTDIPFEIPEDEAEEAAPEGPAIHPDGRVKGLEFLYDGLNDEQRAAVLATEGANLVVAGAGTGKTRVLTTRSAHILARELCKPEEILAVTFTNKAAREMRERIIALVGEMGQRLRMGSFHSISLQILRHHAVQAGLKSPNFKIFDEDDQRQMLENLLIDHPGFSDPDEAPAATQGQRTAKQRKGKAFKDKIRKAHLQIMDLKEDGLTPEAATRKLDLTNPDLNSLAEAYRLYQAALLERNACDFADLILHVVELFRTDESLRQHWARRFRYVLVDEFQDTNPLQYVWLELLARAPYGSGNICVVGDPDQLIYEWRGARPTLLNNFPKDWDGCKIFPVSKNYRSTQQILDVANAIVQENERPAPKVLTSGLDGEPVGLTRFDTAWAEAESVAEDIRKKILAGTDPNEIAILVRSSATMRGFEHQLMLRQIPYIVVGGMKFYQRKEIKDALAYLRLILDPKDEIAFQRVVNTPKRSVGEATALQVVEASVHQPDMLAACRYVADNGKRVTGKAREGLVAFAEAIEKVTTSLADEPPGETLSRIIQEIGYVQWMKEEANDESWREREENLLELVEDANQYADISSYLQQITLLSATDSNDAQDVIRISTIHAAKGLEFEVVYTPALEEAILPNGRAIREPWGLPEERRIAHVAWTRAKKELHVSYCLSRHNSPAMASRFLEEVGLLDRHERGMSAPMRPNGPYAKTGWRGKSSGRMVSAFKASSGQPTQYRIPPRKG